VRIRNKETIFTSRRDKTGKDREHNTNSNTRQRKRAEKK
jgi:hypothetical protein